MALHKESKYLDLAEQFAKVLSKDRSTQVGAFFLHPTEFTILSAGYNGIPRGCDDEAAARHERPLKYEFFEHAERNGIYNSVRDEFRGCRVLCGTPLEIDDVRAIISVGATELHAAGLPAGSTAEQLLAEARVTAHIGSAEVVPGVVLFLATDGTELARAQLDEDELETSVRRAIYAAARPRLANSTVVVAPLPPCEPCARALAAVGAKRVISRVPTADQSERWGASFERTRGLFTSLGVELIET